ncbi:hypothetical protein BpHYR1_002810, partial [Brachionus plicatilis]
LKFTITFIFNRNRSTELQISQIKKISPIRGLILENEAYKNAKERRDSKIAITQWSRVFDIS